MSVIAFDQVKKCFPDFTLELPHLEIQENYITGFIGENGAGKTTTIKLIMNMLFADTGSIQVFGLDSQKDADKIKREIAYVGDIMGFSGTLRLSQIREMIRAFYPNWDNAFYKQMLERFHIRENKLYKDLSKGQNKIFHLLMALSHHPRLLLLDEPTANLDPLIRQDFLMLLSEQMVQEGTSVFFSSHITSDLDKIADYVVFLHQGSVLIHQEKDPLLESHRIVKGSPSLLTQETREILFHIETSSLGFTAMTADYAAAFSLLGQEAVYLKPSLEDLFIAYTRRNSL